MSKVEVGVYYWSAWHTTERTDRLRGKNWTEWEYLKAAIPRFAGHDQPKRPVWGYLDDSKTETLQLQIDTAADHGIDSFIFDWGPASMATGAKDLDTFLAASNSTRLKFGLMVCGDAPESVEDMFRYWIEHYFCKENFWRVDGGLYVTFYELHKYVRRLGGLQKTAEAFARARQLVRDAGLGEVHLVAMEWGLQEEFWQDLDCTPQELVRELHIDAVTSYVWAHNTVPDWKRGPNLTDHNHGPYCEWFESAKTCMEAIDARYPVPYYYHVSTGWDPSPRCPSNEVYTEGGPLKYHNILTGGFDIYHTPYFSTIISENTPEEFRRALAWAKEKAEATGTPLVTLYAWNEWTEGGYLEPDATSGYGRLEAIRDVFGAQD